ncbi:dolichyl-diphosphooligosaccharide---protein glycotransferase [Synchytrium endobioticum]|uniref:Dolichyl-diphosphooligosaccharide--protein glycosyltransferase subunit WBP1 n=1 Tax=Synchytrium endobioticum TaxID=286115 RepID=A0A507D026_9FUNG|nr:dolichyl-diphosphooligosaccharide---protein glycotransferase [Synchytrium endobioticum]TPX44784.1 dolichyl-diphosphooligosaccharide---protein glycotransferase [Synchytrium endobioticum]
MCDKVRKPQSAWLLLCIILFSATCGGVHQVYAKSAQGNRVLMILNDPKEEQTKYSQLVKSLRDRGFTVTSKAAADSSLSLIQYEEKLADHLILFAPEVESYGNEFSIGKIIDYVNAGGNVLVAASSSVSEFIRDLALEFSADFDEAGRSVFDDFHSLDANTQSSASKIKSSNFIQNPHILPPSVTSGPPVIFADGVGHRLTGRNTFIIPVLSGFPSTFTAMKTDGGLDATSILGGSVTLVSALQARNNARVVFTGSVAMFSDEYWNGKADGRKSGNGPFAIELTKWAFHEKGVLKVQNVRHHERNGTQQLGTYHQGPTYRIKDYFTYEIEISKYENDEWLPFTTNDIQLEAIMIDPYYRLPLIPSTPSPAARDTQHYAVTFQLPDVYGVFTFKVDYKRHGLTWLLASDTVPIRPFRHDEYPRFISSAHVYYVNTFSLMIGFVLLCMLWMYHRETKPAGVVKKTQ